MAASPYKGLPPERYWATGVASQTPQSATNLYEKKFGITKKRAIATAGSCFAQHIGRNLRQRGCNVLDAEPAPPGLDAERAKEYGFNIFSARYGNIYTIRQLLQLINEAFESHEPADAVWEKDGRFYDALRPNIEPGGHGSADDVRAHRQSHLRRVRWLLKNTDVFIFTFGLTEAWQHKGSGTVYPSAPGTIAGTFDPDVYEFKNFSYPEILKDFRKVYRALKAKNPEMQFLVTVSPVPLTATAMNQHVLQATTYSKSVLRAVCGTLYEEYADVDYFPSYEIISSPFSKGQFFEPNMRSVTDDGVELVMKNFFASHRNIEAGAEKVEKTKSGAGAIICEEEMLEAFAR